MAETELKYDVLEKIGKSTLPTLHTLPTHLSISVPDKF